LCEKISKGTLIIEEGYAMKLKRLFLYGYLGCYFFGSFSMENSVAQKQIEDEVQRVCELIEQIHFNKYQEYWPMVKRYYLYCDAISLNKDQAAGEICMIEFYISADADKERVLERLVQKHWYVALLMNMSVDKTIAKINRVRGSKIDKRCDQCIKTLLDGTDVRVADGMIYNRVIEHFYSELDGIDNTSLETVPQDLRSIYFTVLKGADQIESSSLALSTDGQYVRATDYHNVDTIWDTVSGKVITNKIDTVVWIPAERDKDWWGYEQSGEKYSVAAGPCHVTIKNLPILNMMQQSSCHIGDTKMITLFKKPDISLYFYQKAFANSQNNLAELIALRDSKHFAEMTGFSKENLKQCIAKQICELTAITTK
jgi:hypothetical protein